jgi:predicted nucleic acid-binding protein
MTPEEVPDGPLMLDTDVFSWLVWEHGPWEAFAALVRNHPFVLAFATVGELRAGALKAKFGEKRNRKLDRLIKECIVLPATDAVVWNYARLHARYRDNLKKDGANDMWIAACSLAEDPAIPIVTGNLGDYRTLSQDFPLRLIHPDLDAPGDT